ncbi:MAG: sigma-70 family RNA polymerase sigma factor [Bacteroidetes bacterium]|nr:sigma-70 family RNA polymerase sigma factor [Bacteroidota bacterium]
MNNLCLSDTELVRLYQQGQDAPFNLLIERYKRSVYSTIYYVVNNKEVAEDIFQETFIKASSYLKSTNYKEMGKVSGWLVSIGRNLALDYYRLNRRRAPFYELQDSEHKQLSIRDLSSLASTQMEQKETAKTIRQFILLLPEEQREVLILRHYADMSFNDIAKTMNSNLNTTLGRMRYALINMRKMIERSKVEV